MLKKHFLNSQYNTILTSYPFSSFVKQYLGPLQHKNGQAGYVVSEWACQQIALELLNYNAYYHTSIALVKQDHSEPAPFFLNIEQNRKQFFLAQFAAFSPNDNYWDPVRTRGYQVLIPPALLDMLYQQYWAENRTEEGLTHLNARLANLKKINGLRHTS